MRLLFIPWVVLLAVSGCTYTSFYSQSGTGGPPIPTQNVKVVRSRGDLLTPWKEVGKYRGGAPTVDEAMNTARQRCAQAGAEFFILNMDPYLSGRRYRVEGVCAVPTAGPVRTPPA